MTEGAHSAATTAVTRWLDRLGPTTHAELRRRLKASHRVHFAAAVAELVACGRVTAEPSERGTRYTLAAAIAPDTSRPPGRACERCGVRPKRPTGRHCGRCLVELAREPFTPEHRHNTIGEIS